MSTRSKSGAVPALTANPDSSGSHATVAFEVNGIRSGRTSPLCRLDHVEHALLVAAERDAVGDARAERRGEEPVERRIAGIDERPAGAGRAVGDDERPGVDAEPVRRPDARAPSRRCGRGVARRRPGARRTRPSRGARRPPASFCCDCQASVSSESSSSERKGSCWMSGGEGASKSRGRNITEGPGRGPSVSSIQRVLGEEHERGRVHLAEPSFSWIWNSRQVPAQPALVCQP